MEEVQQLRLQEKLLELDLSSIQERLSLLRKKIQLLESFEQPTKVNTEPELSGPQSVSTPSQTADGKEQSSPLMVDALPKSILKGTSQKPTPLGENLGKAFTLLKSVKEVSSKPISSGEKIETAITLQKGKTVINEPSSSSSESLNPDDLGKIIQLQPSYRDAVHSMQKVNREHFYVIFNGPHAGIYTNWGVVHTYVSGSQNVAYKKYPSYLMAIKEANKYFHEHGGSPIRLKDNMIPIIPKGPEKAVRFGRIKEIESHEQDQFNGLPYEDFCLLWSKARAADEEDLLAEKFYTADKKTKSLFCFLPGADPTLVHLSFRAGLIKTIYPSSNLQELKLFPTGIKKAIKSFRTKIAKAEDTKVFINITSSIADWENGESFPPYYFCEIGITKEQKLLPSEVVNEESTANFFRIRIDGLKNVLSRSQSLTQKTQAKINYDHPNVIITSWFPSLLSREDNEKIGKFEDAFQHNTLKAGTATKKAFCRISAKSFQTHTCDVCCDASGSKKQTDDACSDASADGQLST